MTSRFGKSTSVTVGSCFLKASHDLHHQQHFAWSITSQHVYHGSSCHDNHADHKAHGADMAPCNPLGSISPVLNVHQHRLMLGDPAEAAVLTTLSSTISA